MDQDRRTPLHLAAMGTSSQSCALLLKNGAKEPMQDIAGKSPLAYAMETENGDCVTLLRLAQLSQEGETGYAGTLADLITDLKINFDDQSQPTDNTTDSIISTPTMIRKKTPTMIRKTPTTPTSELHKKSSMNSDFINTENPNEMYARLGAIRRSASMLMNKYAHLLMENSLSDPNLSELLEDTVEELPLSQSGQSESHPSTIMNIEDSPIKLQKRSLDKPNSAPPHTPPSSHRNSWNPTQSLATVNTEHSKSEKLTKVNRAISATQEDIATSPTRLNRVKYLDQEAKESTKSEDLRKKKT